ncbi:MAG TPA: LysR family transcriptional regulator [Microbacterium sp.]|nr:LysR family transcriptional regulator [Microbacterium sp.]
MDLNLLRVFVAVYESRGLTIAARRLYVTQPAVSQALARLRRELDDPLFEREGRLMRPTPFADAVYPGFREALAGIDRTLDSVHRFDPADSQRLFRIALSELGEIGWFPSILAAVRAEASAVRLEVVPSDPAQLSDWLARGTVDLAITPAAIPFERVLVKAQPYAVAMSERNRLVGEHLDMPTYVSARHVTVESDSGRPVLEAAQRRAGIDVRPSVAVSHFATLPPVLAADPQLIASVPDMIAKGWAQTWPLRVVPLPFEMPAVELYLYRRATTQHTAALDWLFATVARAVRGSSGQFFVIHADAPGVT